MQALIPSPSAPGRTTAAEVAERHAAPDQAVIAVEAFSVNRGETFSLETPAPDWRPGKDVAGVVLRAAADGSGPPAGARVVAHAEHSGWAERVAVATSRIATLPSGVPTTTAAALPLAGLTALRLPRVTGPLAGAKVLLTGASGGVGHAFTELAAAHGAQVTAVSRRGETLLGRGAERVVADVADAGGGFDVALESVGGDVTSAAWRALREGGLLVWMGQASRQSPTFDFLDWSGPLDVTIRKFAYTSGDRTIGDDLATLVRLVAGGHLHPELGRVADWSETGTAIEALLARELRGNAVLTIGTPAPDPRPTAVMERYVEALNAHDGETVTASFSRDAVWRLDGRLPISGTWEGRDAIVNGFFGGARALLQPDSTAIEVTALVAAGDQVALEWTSRARTVAGDPYLNRCFGLFTIRDGLITRVHEYMDTDGAAHQTAGTVA